MNVFLNISVVHTKIICLFILPFAAEAGSAREYVSYIIRLINALKLTIGAIGKGRQSRAATVPNW